MRYAEAKQLIDEVRKTRYKFSDWELNFLSQLDFRYAANAILSSREAGVITEIYRHATGGGKYEKHQIISKSKASDF